MAHARRSDRTGLTALLGMVAMHSAALWWLLQTSDLPVEPPAETALQVVWIERPLAPLPPPSPVAAPPNAATPAPPSTARAGTPPRRAALQAVELAPPASDDTTAATPARSLQEQAGDWARRQAPAVDFMPDPLRHRPAPVRGGRFAMRDPLSAEDVVLAVGRLFGGGPSDPCPRIRDNIANLSDGGDRALIAEELRRLRQFCD